MCTLAIIEEPGCTSKKVYEVSLKSLFLVWSNARSCMVCKFGLFLGTLCIVCTFRCLFTFFYVCMRRFTLCFVLCLYALFVTLSVSHFYVCVGGWEAITMIALFAVA